jgi:hypothetical protein
MQVDTLAWQTAINEHKAPRSRALSSISVAVARASRPLGLLRQPHFERETGETPIPRGAGCAAECWRGTGVPPVRPIAAAAL